nr:retrovirus-related Pol polyprotein from transposon TNT 1-94 [Tanacetum cinerariifolium]
MLFRSVFSKQYWSEAVATECYTQNRSTAVKRHLKTPYEIFHGIIPNIDFLHVFGCLIFIYNNKDHLGKFDERADDGYFLGYLNTRRQQTKETYHITFDESYEAIKFSKPLVDNLTTAESDRYPPSEYLHHYKPSQRWSNDKHIELVNIIGNPEAEMITRVMAKEINTTLDHEFLFVEFLSEGEPRKVFKAHKHLGWVDAIQEELNQLASNKVCTLVPTPYEKTIIGSKWDLLKKYDIDGSSMKTPLIPPNNLGPDLNGKAINEIQYRGEVGLTSFRNAIGTNYLSHSRNYVAPSTIETVEIANGINLLVNIDYAKLIWEEILAKMKKAKRENVVPDPRLYHYCWNTKWKDMEMIKLLLTSPKSLAFIIRFPKEKTMELQLDTGENKLLLLSCQDQDLGCSSKSSQQGYADTHPAEWEKNTRQATITQLFKQRTKKDAEKANLKTQQMPTTTTITSPIIPTTTQLQSPFLPKIIKEQKRIKESIKADMAKKEEVVGKEELIDLLGIDIVTEVDHAHLTKEIIKEQKRIKESIKADMAKKEEVVGKEELIDLLGIDIVTEVMQACPKRTRAGWTTIYEQIQTRMENLHKTEQELRFDFNKPLGEQDPLEKLSDLARKKRKHADDIHDYFRSTKRYKSSV